MILYIDTTQNNLIEIGVKDKNEFIARKKFKSDRTQAEKLLPGIDKLLKAVKLKLTDFRLIQAANQGGSFTSLRIGIITANGLGYALGIPVAGESGGTKKLKEGKRTFNVVEPRYSSEARITLKKPAVDNF